MARRRSAAYRGDVARSNTRPRDAAPAAPLERRALGARAVASPRYVGRRLRDALPRGRLLPESVWEGRHRAIVTILWLHVIGLAAFALLTGHTPLEALASSSPVAFLTLAASVRPLSRGLRSCAASLGLVTASAVLVHLSGGYIEAHFHFFVVLGVLALYQDWAPFLIAIGYVIVHHALVGIVDPNGVFNHPGAKENPALWALIHGAFVLAASSVNIVTWRFVEHQSLHDPLTNLPNRALFADRLAAALKRASRSATSVGVLFIDLDDFKAVNDRLGHAAGDEMLRQIAARIRAGLRSTDTAGRLGGDEFGALIEDVATPSDVEAVAGRVAAMLRPPTELAGEVVHISASIGVSTARGPGHLTEEVLRRADNAMYAEKRRRQDRRVRFGTPLGTPTPGTSDIRLA
jgi:diguanylate cyclase